MATGYYNAKSIPPREVLVDTLEIYNILSGEVREYGIDILDAEKELNALLHELWPDFFPA